MHIDKWRVSFSLLRETVEIWVNFGEAGHGVWTVIEYEEVAMWHSADTDVVHHLLWNTPVNVIRLYERTFKDLKFQRFCFVFLLLWFPFENNSIKSVPCYVHSEKPYGNGVQITLSSCFHDPSKGSELCSVCYCSGEQLCKESTGQYFLENP